MNGVREGAGTISVPQGAERNGVGEGAGTISVPQGGQMNGVREGIGTFSVHEGAEMNGIYEGADMKDGTDEGTGMDAAAAAAIVAEAGERARNRLRPGHRVRFIVWGLLYIIGYGATWLLVRAQHPFRGPAPATFAVTSLIALAVILVSVEQVRSETGVRGPSAVRRRASLLAALAGFAAMFTLEGALARADASRPVLVVFEAAAPILVVGLLYLAGSVGIPDWTVAGLGLWLIIVAAASGYAGPRTVWGIDTLAVGPAFLLAAAIGPRPRQS
jgi:hypothetical protein